MMVGIGNGRGRVWVRPSVLVMVVIVWVLASVLSTGGVQVVFGSSLGVTRDDAAEIDCQRRK